MELKPCPFCGGTNLYVDGYKHDAGLRWRVVCLNCTATVDPGTIQQKYRAIEAWNNRTPSELAADLAKLERLRAEIDKAKDLLKRLYEAADEIDGELCTVINSGSTTMNGDEYEELMNVFGEAAIYLGIEDEGAEG